MALALLNLMANRIHLTFALLGALALGACSNADTMNDGPSILQAALTDARVENVRHLSACQATDSLVGMAAELERHDANMTPLIDRMVGAHGRMNHCSGGNFDGLARSLTDMHSAMSDHDHRMQSAATLDTAKAECSAHIGETNTMMQDMMGDLAGMSCMMGMRG